MSEYVPVKEEFQEEFQVNDSAVSLNFKRKLTFAGISLGLEPRLKDLSRRQTTLELHATILRASGI